jgi:hypothetical protein
LKVELGNKVEAIDKLKMKMVENWKVKAKTFDASQKKVINKSKWNQLTIWRQRGRHLILKILSVKILHYPTTNKVFMFRWY